MGAVGAANPLSPCRHCGHIRLGDLTSGLTRPDGVNIVGAGSEDTQQPGPLGTYSIMAHLGQIPQAGRGQNAPFPTVQRGSREISPINTGHGLWDYDRCGE